jgi:hypothetical protein
VDCRHRRPLRRKSWLQAVGGFRKDLPCSQELDLHLRIVAVGITFQTLPEVLSGVRRVVGSVSSNAAKVLLQHRRIVEPVFELLANRGELDETRRRAFAAFIARDARALYRADYCKDAREYLQLAFKFHGRGGLDEAFSISIRPVAWLLEPAFRYGTPKIHVKLYSLLRSFYKKP